MARRSIVTALFVMTGAWALSSAPASAMHWIIYAPDEAGYRYWMDEDSIVTKEPYTFVTYVLGDADSNAPTSPAGTRIGLNCSTGDSVYDENGQLSPGPHFTDKAYLFNETCKRKK
jgi:hypothetical protein